MMRKLPNTSKNLLNVQCFALESFVVFLESVANVFFAKIASFGKFRLVVRNDSNTARIGIAPRTFLGAAESASVLLSEGAQDVPSTQDLHSIRRISQRQWPLPRKPNRITTSSPIEAVVAYYSTAVRT